MADPRAPVDIAKFATQFEAEAVAEVIRAVGIEAVVFGGGSAFAGGLGGFGEWIVLAPSADAARARQAVVEARGQHVPRSEVDHCPWCGYSMAGLEEAEKCPECGRELEPVRAATRVRGLVQGPEPLPAHYRSAMRGLWAAIGVCGVLGLGALVSEMAGGRGGLSAMWQYWVLIAVVASLTAIVFTARARRIRRSRLRRSADAG